MKRHTAVAPEQAGPAARSTPVGSQATRPAQTQDAAGQCADRASPIVVLSYAYSGAQRVQGILTAGTELAGTSGTGIIPLCAAAAETWQRVEDRTEPAMSRLAVSTIRALVIAQLTAILASTGKPRWCELSTAAASAAAWLLQILPHTAFVCVHRRCLDVIQAAAMDNPWGLGGAGLAPYLLRYPGNSVAALAAHWATTTEELLAFEKAHPDNTRRVRYEDMIAEASAAPTALRTWLGLADSQPAILPEPQNFASSTAHAGLSGAAVPVEMIPEPLRQRITHLNTELGYPQPW
jgi:hypothetical protein